MRYLIFIFTQTVRNLRHSWEVQLMTMLTITLSVLIFSFFYLVYTNMLQAGDRLGDDLRLIVYLESGLNEEGQKHLSRKISEYNQVDDIVFVTPEEAFKRLKEQLDSDRDVLDDLDPSFLPYSVEIAPSKSLKNLTKIKEFSDFLATLPGAVKVQYGHGWVERFGYFIQLLRFIVITSGTLLILTTMFMVSYTLRLTLYARQKELKVLRYLGATNSYIEGPVLVEGFVIGFWGSGCGLGALYFLFQWLTNHFDTPGFMSLFQLTFLPWTTCAVILIVSILLCTFGSLLSIRKLLKI